MQTNWSMTKKQLMEEMGNNLRNLRIMKKLSRAKLSRQLGITPGFLALIENGKRGMTSHMLLTVAKHFNMRVEYFFRSVEIPLSECDIDLEVNVNDSGDGGDGLVIFIPVIVCPRRDMRDIQMQLLRLKRDAVCDESVFKDKRKLELLAELLRGLG